MSLGVGLALLAGISCCSGSTSVPRPSTWSSARAMWLAVLQSGVHPTLAGVMLGLLTPSVAFQRPRAVSDEAHRTAATRSTTRSRPTSMHRSGCGSPSCRARPSRRSRGSRPPSTPGRAPSSCPCSPWPTRASSCRRRHRARRGHEPGRARRAAGSGGRQGGGDHAREPRRSPPRRAAPPRGRASTPPRHGGGRRHPFTVSLFVTDRRSRPGVADVAKIGILGASILAGAIGVLVLRSGRRGRSA